MSGPTNHQTPPPTNSISSSPGPIAQQLVQLQGAGQTPPNPPQPTTTPGKASSKKRGKSWKEVREWLNIIGILLIPLLIGVYTFANNIQQTSLAQQNRQADVANQLDQQRETALKTYEDDISSLLLDRHLATSRPGDEIRTVALAKTLEVLHQLDSPHNVRAIQFLQDAQLIGADFTTKTPHTHNIIDFSSADLTNDDLSGANLSGANLREANLTRASLVDADLHGSYLRFANLSFTNLSWVSLSSTDLSFTYLRGANLTHANLVDADLHFANLREANLNSADLRGANLHGAYLSRVYLGSADLRQADLSITDLSSANLRFANLGGAIMPNGTKHSCQRGEESFCK